MRLIIVSNRLPVSVTQENGNISAAPSSGGLVSSLESYIKHFTINPTQTYAWFGWPGAVIDTNNQTAARSLLEKMNYYPVFLSSEEVEAFYNGFCNDTLWPLFHYFTSYVSYNSEAWQTYKTVNEKFCDAIVPYLKPGDVVWIHDYHLMLLPQMLRARVPDATIGFFLHIPFPAFELFRLLPHAWQHDLIRGILGADLAGFHTYDYTRYFLDVVQRVTGLEPQLGTIEFDSRVVKADTFPIQIDFEKYASAPQTPEAQEELKQLQYTLGNQKVILSVDRLDYTKGINNRLEAYQLFLANHPEWRGKVTLELVVVPSRTAVERYQKMKRSIDELVGTINGAFGSTHWSPIIYQYRSLASAELAALYNRSDLALVTPLRDGMNLVAKEYVAAQRDGAGVLILSEGAGAAEELGEAIVVNPNHVEEIADAIHYALTIPDSEAKLKIERMQNRLRRYTVVEWAEDFIAATVAVANDRDKEITRALSSSSQERLVNAFRNAKRRLLLLDYDGTLVPFSTLPHLAVPDNDLLSLIRQLATISNTTVALTSGRDKKTITEWFGETTVELVAEHGIWHRAPEQEWHMMQPFQNGWKEHIIPILRRYADRIPGSFVEEKEFSVAWHYRAAHQLLAKHRSLELVNTLTHLTANLDVQIINGKCVVEVRPNGADKGSAALSLLNESDYDFVLAVGDDTTDEDMFRALPDSSYTIKIGSGLSAARFTLPHYHAVRTLLTRLAYTLDHTASFL